MPIDLHRGVFSSPEHLHPHSPRISLVRKAIYSVKSTPNPPPSLPPSLPPPLVTVPLQKIDEEGEGGGGRGLRQIIVDLTASQGQVVYAFCH